MHKKLNLDTDGAICGNYTVTADAGSSYEWLVQADTPPAVSTVSNGNTVEFAGGGAGSDEVPIITMLAGDGSAESPHTVTITLTMEDSEGSFDASTDIPISWQNIDGKLKLFISHTHLEDC